MKVENLRSLIRESINEYIREIDNAGNKAALEAKMTATQEAIDIRKKKMNMEGLDEAYHDMLDKNKVKELSGEVKALEKSLTKLKKQLDKLNSKSEPKAEVKDEVIDEVNLEEDDMPKVQKLKGKANWNDQQRGFSWNSDQLYDDAQLEEGEESQLGGKKVPAKFKDSDSTDWIEDLTAPEGKFSDKESDAWFEEDELEEARFKKGTDIGKKGKGFEKIAKAAGKEYGSKEAGKRVAGAILKKVLNKETTNPADDPELKAAAEKNDKEYSIMNESFLKMQKLAGVITEAQYNEKKSLIENQLNEDNLEVKSIAKKLYSWLKQNGVAASLATQNVNFKQIGIKDPKQQEATIYVFDDPSSKQTIIRVSLRGKESIVKDVENKLLTTYPGLEEFNKQQYKLYSGGMTNPQEIPGAINLTFDLKEKTTAKGGLVGNTKTNENQLNEDEVDFKLTELKNKKVADLKKEMEEKKLTVLYRLGNKEFKPKPTSTGSGWDAKTTDTVHNAYLTWNGEPNGTILVGIGKDTNKAQEILPFVEKTFKDEYDIQKGGTASYWEIRIVPKQK